jgi:predicted N-acetyltransferase YhbS
MLIRPLTETDIPHTAAIVGRNYPEEAEKYVASATLELHAMFGDAPIKPGYFVAVHDDQILGFAGFMQSWMDYNIYNVFWVNVDPKHQRQGIGKELVRTVIDAIRLDANACMILLTTTSPKYYADHFGFKALQPFMDGEYQLMSLSLENSVA